MLSGKDPAADHVDGLETYLMAVVNHGLNASTFTARVITSICCHIRLYPA